MRLRLRLGRAEPSAKGGVLATGWDPNQHSCSEVVDGMPQLDSPLVTELIALQAHTRHLGWLSSRENARDQYRHLARIAVQGLLEGWQAQTSGSGRIEDLLTDEPRDVRVPQPSVRPGRLPCGIAAVPRRENRDGRAG
ncbi:hypothetical protein ACWGII_42365 [Streptomyces sp. NPDC054855]